ncbi:MAG: ribosome maturation factor RimM [Clostridia bacterium]|nr:ribosome maturation factor RimM [Clostridia bacterium]
MIFVLQIVNTHGVHGEVKAIHYTDGEIFFKKVKTVYKEDSTPVRIISSRFQKGAVLLKLEGIDTLDKAQALKFTKLYAREEDLPTLPEGEFYFFQLMGLKGQLESGNVFGTVTDVIENNAANLLEFTKDNGKKVLIPNIGAFVKKVDLENKAIHITPIEGLIDDEI